MKACLLCRNEDGKLRWIPYICLAFWKLTWNKRAFSCSPFWCSLLWYLDDSIVPNGNLPGPVKGMVPTGQDWQRLLFSQNPVVTSLVSSQFPVLLRKYSSDQLFLQKCCCRSRFFHSGFLRVYLSVRHTSAEVNCSSKILTNVTQK